MTITLPTTPKDKFNGFSAFYTSDHEDATDMQVLSAFLDRNRDIPPEGIRELIRDLADIHINV